MHLTSSSSHLCLAEISINAIFIGYSFPDDSALVAHVHYVTEGHGRFFFYLIFLFLHFYLDFHVFVIYSLGGASWHVCAV